jgi:hypothetical protein
MREVIGPEEGAPRIVTDSELGLPVSAETCDFMLCNCALHPIFDPLRGFANPVRVTRTGGTKFLSHHGPYVSTPRLLVRNFPRRPFAEGGFEGHDIVRSRRTIHDHRTLLDQPVNGEGYLQFRAVKRSPNGLRLVLPDDRG